MLHARADYDDIQDPTGKIPVDEPVFLIRGQDPIAAEVVRGYAERAEAAGCDPALVAAVRRHAERMKLWAGAHPRGPADADAELLR